MPCRHSWKPPLETLFAPYLSTRGSCVHEKACAYTKHNTEGQRKRQQEQQQEGGQDEPQQTHHLLQGARMLELFAREMRPG
jgi:hypothetical protein